MSVTRIIKSLTVIVQVFVLMGKVRENIPEATFAVEPNLPRVYYDLQVSTRLDLTRSVSQSVSQ